MRKFILAILVVILMLAMAVPAIAHPSGQGTGCGCHRVAEKVTGSIHAGFMMLCAWCPQGTNSNCGCDDLVFGHQIGALC